VDDFELDLGRLRIRRSGSDGGHNGLKSIISMLGPEFARLRLGIGPAPARMPVEVFVLKPFRSDERESVDWMLDRATEAALAWTRGADLQSLMNEYNRRPPDAALC
jgi:PTH1 family peptidyl-tRNA hydrolase